MVILKQRRDLIIVAVMSGNIIINDILVYAVNVGSYKLFRKWLKRAGRCSTFLLLYGI